MWLQGVDQKPATSYFDQEGCITLAMLLRESPIVGAFHDRKKKAGPQRTILALAREYTHTDYEWGNIFCAGNLAHGAPANKQEKWIPKTKWVKREIKFLELQVFLFRRSLSPKMPVMDEKFLALWLETARVALLKSLEYGLKNWKQKKIYGLKNWKGYLKACLNSVKRIKYIQKILRYQSAKSGGIKRTFRQIS